MALAQTYIFYTEASKRKVTAGQLFSDLQNLKLDPSIASKLCQAWKHKSEDARHVCQAVKRLVDVEWKFGVTASNSEVHRVGNCYIQVSERKTVCMFQHVRDRPMCL